MRLAFRGYPVLKLISTINFYFCCQRYCQEVSIPLIGAVVFFKLAQNFFITILKVRFFILFGCTIPMRKVYLYNKELSPLIHPGKCIKFFKIQKKNQLFFITG
jgi:hypothetical protein